MMVMLYKPFLACVLAAIVASAAKSSSDRANITADEWVVQLTETSTDAEANALAEKHGLVNFGRIGSLSNMYRFVYTGDNSKHPVGLNSGFERAMRNDIKVTMVNRQLKRVRVKKEYQLPKAPKWNRQWSLKNTGQTNGPIGLDLNVEKAWLQSATGIGILVGVVDDGLEWTHPGIKDNYEPSASHDFINNDNDPTPDPTDEGSDEPNSHGTSCAGEISATRDNHNCGVGVAYSSKVAALKLLSAAQTDAAEASALGHMINDIMIYSNSWGPSDTGFSVDGPGELVDQTFSTNAKNGRNGKGSIYVWAAGNGGFYYDSCAADGYVNSIYTIAVGSADQNGHQADYDENCTAKIAVTYSYNSDTFPFADDDWDAYNQITTLDLNGGCTDGFTGTSASAPLVSATIALALEVNPSLTWRDIQYLIVYTSDNTKLNGEWTTNGAGLKVSSQFGFGAIDAEAMVTRGKHWINVPHQQHLSLQMTKRTGSALYYSDFTSSITVQSNDIRYLEHVVLTITLTIVLDAYETEYYYSDFYDHYSLLKSKTVEYEDFVEDKSDSQRDYDSQYPWLTSEDHSRRGDISVRLTSPSGTTSILLPYRQFDYINSQGYTEWPFMSLHYWGEDPVGQWTVTVYYTNTHGHVNVEINNFEMYGVSETPAAVSQIPRFCSESCARGCAAPGMEFCDGCAEFRDADTLKCTSQCFNTTHYNGYCIDCITIEASDCSSSTTTSLKPSSSTATSSSSHSFSTVILIISVVFGVCLILLLTVCVVVILCIVKHKSIYSSSNNRTNRYWILSTDANDNDDAVSI